MSERDHELVAARRTCALLSREEMLDGKVPTTATSSSVIAAIQVQEAVKLLHRDRLGEPTLAGSGFAFVGLTHDSYVVNYPKREDCLAHDTYELDDVIDVPEGTAFEVLIEKAKEVLGPDAVIDLEHEVLLTASCSACDTTVTVNRPVDALKEGEGVCDGCGSEMRLEFTHSVSGDSAIASLEPSALGLPPGDIYSGRSGMDRIFFRMGAGLAT